MTTKRTAPNETPRLERDLEKWEAQLSAKRRFRVRDIKKWLHWIGRSALAPERFL